ncbi:hypothetical protein HYPSUDRAFT_282607 [Hypholoma sublateritium FD-334 SS-4]|uniref:F-box domain-containing protein n=1 Tax=Hypholoma sublateritium (strain FD-334 SS-4) TaxID=945553 RepID=A0A0D2MRW5_HYPSF|nr:hypothetical protein HYPSUDRAFT_282607 [Hypholoma sublateritium FD-334 SS-4]
MSVPPLQPNDVRRSGSVWHSLQYDLLHYIVDMNADMFSDGTALETTRRTAQVCRTWREMMLNTPALWANLIDLDKLRLASNEWRVEVLRRSGDALLSLKAEFAIAAAPSPISQFFFNILDSRWDRIQRLYVRSVVCSSELSDWAPLFRPAPHLKSCVLHFGTPKVIRHLEGQAPGPLLASNAPMLRELNAWHFKFDIHAPWMYNLRALHIGSPFTLCEILTALGKAPNLRYLYVNDISDLSSQSPLHVVSLPSLCRLTLSVRIRACICVLDYLDLSSSCALEYSPPKIRRAQEIEKDTFCLSINAISKFAARHFQKCSPQYVSLCHDHNSILFRAGRYPNDITFTFHLSSAPHINLPTYATSTLLHALTLREFAHATKLQLRIHDLFPSEAFAPFLVYFDAVEKVEINERAITHLIEASSALGLPEDKERRTLFPVLKALKITELSSLYVRCNTGVMMRFVRTRRDAGLPLAVLDLAQYEPNGAPENIASIERDGLTVQWTRQEDGDNLEEWFGQEL